MKQRQLMRIIRQAIKGVPYLRKEMARKASLQAGRVFATPCTYYVIFSGRCNIACPFCTIHRVVEPTLSSEIMMRIIREAKELSGSGFNMSLSGGEPMIYKPLYGALELAHRLGVNFGFTTNGLALTPANVERALSFDPFNINISLESVDAKINEALRPFPKGTRKVLDGIDTLLKEKERTGSRVRFIVKPTIMEQNYRSLPELVRYFGKKSRNCDIGLRSMIVYANADVFFCDFLKKPIGNMHQNSLSEIYYAEMAGKQRKVMVYCNIDCQQTCKRPTSLLVKARAFLKMG